MARAERIYKSKKRPAGKIKKEIQEEKRNAKKQ